MSLLTAIRRFRYLFDEADYFRERYDETAIDQLVVNLDAGVAASIRSGASAAVEGDAVTAFNDQTSYGHHATQATSANMPEYLPMGIGGATPCVSFDGLDDYLDFATGLALTQGVDGYTIIHVADLTLDGAYRQVFAVQGATPYHERFSYFLNAYGFQQRTLLACRADSDSQATLNSTSSAIAGGFAVESISMDFCAQTAHIYRNGVKLAESNSLGTGSGRVSATAANKHRIGAASGGAIQKVAQHLEIQRYVSQYEIVQHHKGLMTKWGIAW